jgi:hypothetical protein
MTPMAMGKDRAVLDTLVEVKKGIQGGEHVALDPLSLLTEVERARLDPATWPAAKPARKRRAVK